MRALVAVATLVKIIMLQFELPFEIECVVACSGVSRAFCCRHLTPVEGCAQLRKMRFSKYVFVPDMTESNYSSLADSQLSENFGSYSAAQFSTGLVLFGRPETFRRVALDRIAGIISNGQWVLREMDGVLKDNARSRRFPVVLNCQIDLHGYVANEDHVRGFERKRSAQLFVAGLSRVSNQVACCQPQSQRGDEQQKGETDQKGIRDLEAVSEYRPELGSLISSILSMILGYATFFVGLRFDDRGGRFGFVAFTAAATCFGFIGTVGFVLGWDFWSLCHLLRW